MPIWHATKYDSIIFEKITLQKKKKKKTEKVFCKEKNFIIGTILCYYLCDTI
jgi:hypothetical protein